MNQQVKNNPVPVKLGGLKPLLQQEAMEIDRSMHYLILKIIGDYYKGKVKAKKDKK